MKRSAVVMVVLVAAVMAVVTLTIGAAEARPTLSKARTWLRRHKPILRYPSGDTRWQGWRVPPGKAGRILPASDLCALNLGFGYVDPVKGGKIKPRTGGLAFRLGRATNKLDKPIRRVADTAYRWAGLR
jgi:hypothetical protein